LLPPPTLPYTTLFRSSLESRIRVPNIGKLHHQRRIDLQSHGVRELLRAFPPWRAVNKHFGAADKCNLAVPQMVEMLERQPSSRLDRKSTRLNSSHQII